jgi:hypothetical protein
LPGPMRNMAAIGLAEAARMTGRNPSTIHRALKAGRLSYTKDAAGERRIDVAELERVFGIKLPTVGNLSIGNGAMPATDAASMQSNATHGSESERVIAAQRETIAQQDATIRHLRDLVDREAEERRWLIAALTDQRARPWWRRWLR